MPGAAAVTGPLPYGATAWTFSWVPPFDRAIRRIAATGCRHVELVAWNAAMLRDYYTPSCMRALSDLMASEGLTLTNFFFNLPFAAEAGASVSTPDLDAFARVVDTAAALGSPLVTSGTPYPFARPVRPLLHRPTAQEWTAAVEPQWDWDGEYANVVEAIGGACALAQKAGLRVAIEPHPYRWVSSAQGMLRLLEHVGAPNLGLNFDPSHLFPSGDMPHFTVLMLKDRIFNTHFSDNDGHTNAHWRPGRGKIDWAAILLALRQIGYSGPITLELEDAPGASHYTHTEDATPTLEFEMKQAMAFLDGVNAAIGERSP